MQPKFIMRWLVVVVNRNDHIKVFSCISQLSCSIVHRPNRKDRPKNAFGRLISFILENLSSRVEEDHCDKHIKHTPASLMLSGSTSAYISHLNPNTSLSIKFAVFRLPSRKASFITPDHSMFLFNITNVPLQRSNVGRKKLTLWASTTRAATSSDCCEGPTCLSSPRYPSLLDLETASESLGWNVKKAFSSSTKHPSPSPWTYIFWCKFSKDIFLVSKMVNLLDSWDQQNNKTPSWTP